MPAPKSVVKIVKDKEGAGITYTSNVDATQYYMYELTRAALRDVAKFVMAEWKIRYYNHFKKRTGNAIKAIYSKVWSSKSTLYPKVEIGLPHSKKGKPVKGFYSFFQEFGTSKTPRLGLLTNSVYENIGRIREIESKYLSYIEADDWAKDFIIDQEGNAGEEIEVED